MTRTTQYDHATLAKTLDGQLYVVTRSQALACGLTPGALRHRTQPDGPWRTLLPGVYLVDAREPNVPPRLFALDNVVLAPHVAGSTHETWDEASALLVRNLDHFFTTGRPLTPVTL